MTLGCILHLSVEQRSVNHSVNYLRLSNITHVTVVTMTICTQSCPAIQVYSAKNIERGLDQAAMSFCEQEVDITPDSRQVLLSKIFQWYACDFGGTERDVLQ